MNDASDAYVHALTNTHAYVVVYNMCTVYVAHDVGMYMVYICMTVSNRHIVHYVVHMYINKTVLRTSA